MSHPECYTCGRDWSDDEQLVCPCCSTRRPWSDRMCVYDDTLQRWEHPECYSGCSPVGAFIAATVHRDSNALDRANYDAIRAALVDKYYETMGAAADPGLDDDEESTLIEWHAGHYAVGWIDTLCVNVDAPREVLDLLVEIHEGLADYPVVDEDLLFEYEHEEACDYWTNCCLAERYELVKGVPGVSVFAIRHDEMPHYNGTVYDNVRARIDYS